MKLNTQKGVSLISLTITVIVLIIITSMLIYNAKNGVSMRNLNMMENDIELLDDKINSYYVKYGAIPAEIKYLGDIRFTSQPNDSKEYYVIDLKALEGINLNYGKDFNDITNENDTLNKSDVYIIDKQSHHIYYAKGIQMDGVLYFTTTQDEEIHLIRKALIAMPNINDTEATLEELDLWQNTIIPHMQQHFSDAYPEMLVTIKIGTDATQYLNETLENEYEYDIIIIQDAIWAVPEIANELAQKYNLLTIGNDSIDNIDIIESTDGFVTSVQSQPYTDHYFTQSLAMTDYGENVINQVAQDTQDTGVQKIEFIEDAKILYTATYSSEETGELYIDGEKSNKYPLVEIPVIAEWKNPYTNKTWVHSQFAIGSNDSQTDYDLMVKLIKHILGDL